MGGQGDRGILVTISGSSSIDLLLKKHRLHLYLFIIHLLFCLTGKENNSPSKYIRSMSIESPRHFASTHDFMYPSYVLEDDGCREMAVDVHHRGGYKTDGGMVVTFYQST